MAKLEKLENNKVKLTFEITRDELDKGMDKAFQEAKGSINLPGFRKGKAPRKVIENFYGKNYFFEEGLNHSIPAHYENAVKEHDLEVVSNPELDIDEVVDDKPITVFAEVYVKPEVKIENYKGITYIQPVYEVTDEEVNDRIEQDRGRNSRVINIDNRPVKVNDNVIIDFEGFIDEIPFEGGKAEDYELVIGSKTFIDTFEEQIIGHNLNEEFDVLVNFPEDYQQEELKGKPAKFVVKVKEITETELPELDDDFAQDVSEFDTLDEYKKNIADEIGKTKAQSAEAEAEDVAMDNLINIAEVDLPEIMVTNQVNALVNDAAQRMSMQGLDMNMFLQYTGQTMEQYREQHAVIAKKQVLGRLILEEIAERESINVSEEDIDKEIDRIAKEYNMESTELKNIMRESDKKGLNADVKVQKAMKFVMEHAIAEEPSEEDETKEEK